MSSSAKYRVMSGVWGLSGSVHRGTCDGTLSARKVSGSELHRDYEFDCRVKMSAGKAGVIVNYTVTAENHEKYLEMTLDATNDLIKLDSVERDENGAEVARTNAASRNYPLSFGTEYAVHVESKEIDIGVFAVYCYVDRDQVVWAEDLADPYRKGMHGFESLGNDGEYVDFTETSDVTMIEIEKSKTIDVSVNDYGYKLGRFWCERGGEPFDLTGYAVSIKVFDPATETVKFTGNCTIAEAETGEVYYTVASGNFDAPSKVYTADIIATKTGAEVTFGGIKIRVGRKAVS